MTRRVGCWASALLCSGLSLAAELQPVTLPAPQIQGGKPLMQALAARQSAREFGSRKLAPQVLSNLLWAACGINRPDGKRTAPSAMNRQEIDVYVVTPDGSYVYRPKENRLDPVASGDLRALTGTQAYAATAALELVFVADLSKAGGGSAEDKALYTGADTGFISQNVYLFCASEGLGTVVRASIDRAALGKALKLTADQRITLAQSIGYPRE